MKKFSLILLLITLILSTGVDVFASDTVSESKYAAGKIFSNDYLLGEGLREVILPKGETVLEENINDSNRIDYGEKSLDKVSKLGDSILIDDLNNFVAFRIQSDESFDILGIKIIYKFQYGDSISDYFYNEESKVVKYIDQINEREKVITFGEFDWSKADSFTITISTWKEIYVKKITQSDLGKVYSLQTDSTYVPLEVDIPFASNDIQVNLIYLSVPDENGIAYTIGCVFPGGLVPAGVYSVQVTGEDSAYSYCLFKNGFLLSESNNRVTFSQSEVSLVTLYNNSPSYPITHFLAYPRGKSYGTVCYVNVNINPGTYKRLLISKLEGRFSYNYKPSATSSDYSEYIGHKDDFSNVSGSQTVYANHILSTSIDASQNTTYYGGDEIYELSIVNNLGHTFEVYSRFGSEILELNRSGESYSLDASYGYVKLPNPKYSGNFTATYRIDGGIIPIASSSSTLNIQRIVVPAYDAVSVFSSLPSYMFTGEIDSIELSLMNTGTNSWVGSNFRLVSAEEDDPFTSVKQYPLSASDNIKENEIKSFSIGITAPMSRGIYETVWIMSDGYNQFGYYQIGTIRVRTMDNPYKVILGDEIKIVSFSTDKQSPQQPGETISITAVATGGIERYYQFWLNDGTGWTMAQPYSRSDTFSWTPQKAGNYQIGVWVKDKNSVNQYDKDSIIDYTIGNPEPVAITGLTTDKVSPQVPGTTITITATATGGSEKYYQFWIHNGTEWIIAQPYSTSNTCSWTPSNAGGYKLGVWVKDKNSVNQYDKDSVIEYTIGNPEPVAITGLTTDKVSPQAPGITIRITATATGGSEKYYQFWIHNGTEWVIAQPYSTSNTCSWTPSNAGTYKLGVWVKDKNSANQYDKDSIIEYTIGNFEPVAITGLTTNKISPQAPGTTIRITATATGGSEKYYQFWIHNGTEWVIAQPYSTSNICYWTPSITGNYKLGVWVKDKNSVNQYDKDIIIYYTIGNLEPVAITGLTTNKVSPQAPGTTITITASATGGGEKYYQFWIHNGTEWIIAQPYSTASTCIWRPSIAGNYKLGVWVKDKNSVNQYDKDSIIEYTIGNPEPVAITGLTTDKVSPQAPGITIRITATATGGSEKYYQFWIHNGTEWIIAQPYSTSNTCSWTPSNAGIYKLGVWVKDKNSVNQYDKDSIIDYTIGSIGPIVITGLTTDKASPQKLGAQIRWECNSVEGINPEYCFDVYKIDGGSNLKTGSSGYTPSRYFDWPATEAGVYKIQVFVKESGNTYSTPTTLLSDMYIVNTPFVIESADLIDKEHIKLKFNQEIESFYVIELIISNGANNIGIRAIHSVSGDEAIIFTEEPIETDATFEGSPISIYTSDSPQYTESQYGIVLEGNVHIILGDKTAPEVKKVKIDGEEVYDITMDIASNNGLVNKDTKGFVYINYSEAIDLTSISRITYFLGVDYSINSINIMPSTGEKTVRLSVTCNNDGATVTPTMVQIYNINDISGNVLYSGGFYEVRCSNT